MKNRTFASQTKRLQKIFNKQKRNEEGNNHGHHCWSRNGGIDMFVPQDMGLAASNCLGLLDSYLLQMALQRVIQFLRCNFGTSKKFDSPSLNIKGRNNNKCPNI